MKIREAIDLLDNLIGMVGDNQGNDYDDALKVAIVALKAQSDGDTISRQAAIEAIFNEPLCESGMKERTAIAVVLAIYEKINSLPSAQPETCDTCKHGYFGDTQCDNCCVRYPSHYERRIDE